MSQRNRMGRKEDSSTDVQEEREIWARIQMKLTKELVHTDSKIKEAEREVARLKEICEGPEFTNADIDDLIEALNNLKTLSAEESRLLRELSEDDLSILQGLRKATEQGIGGSNNGIKRKRNESTTIESPANRSKPPARSMSVPNEVNKDLKIGDQVAFRLPKQKGAEGEWIQCVVMNIHGDGPKRRYEVQDPEPDDAGPHGQTYKASGAQLIFIPLSSTGLQAYPNGKQVLARYPETTTFYKAELIGTKRDGTCKLKFEGEEEVGKETEVERRLVLEFGGK